jgi:hypothetical protein
MNGTVDARHVLKKAMGVKLDKDLKRGVTSQDVLLFFKEVVKMNAEHGRDVKFEWKREGLNHSAKKGKGWSGKDCKKTFSQVGKFVVLGTFMLSSRVTCRKHEIQKAVGKKAYSEATRKLQQERKQQES